MVIDEQRRASDEHEESFDQGEAFVCEGEERSCEPEAFIYEGEDIADASEGVFAPGRDDFHIVPFVL
jgi:hypothetical protein